MRKLSKREEHRRAVAYTQLVTALQAALEHERALAAKMAAGSLFQRSVQDSIQQHEALLHNLGEDT